MSDEAAGGQGERGHSAQPSAGRNSVLKKVPKKAIEKVLGVGGERMVRPDDTANPERKVMKATF